MSEGRDGGRPQGRHGDGPAPDGGRPGGSAGGRRGGPAGGGQGGLAGGLLGRSRRGWIGGGRFGDGPHPGRRRRLQGLVLLGAVLLLLGLGGGPASAHAALRGADPVDGSVVKTSPGSITLTFTESVGLLDDSFRVFDPDNRRVDTGRAGHADGRTDTARVTLPRKLGTGTFTVSWRVVSADSHPIAGAFTFSVGKPSAVPPALPSTSVEDPATSGLFNIGRYVAYIAAALLIGTCVFVAVCGPPDVRPLRRLLLAGWWALAGSTVFLLLLRAPYETGAGPAQALDLSGLTRTLSTRPGLALVARLVLLAAVAALLLRQRALPQGERPSRASLVTGGALAVALTLTWAAAEHASAGIQVPAAMTSSVLHLLAMAAWLGGLTALLTLLHRASVPSYVVTRFSRTAGLAVVVLVVTGVYQSWRGLGSASALTDTTYGRVLLAKLAAVTVLLTAGAWSRRTVRNATTAKTAGTASTAKAAARSKTADAVSTATTPGNVTTAAPEATETIAQREARVPQPVGGRAAAADGADADRATRRTDAEGDADGDADRLQADDDTGSRPTGDGSPADGPTGDGPTQAALPAEEPPSEGSSAGSARGSSAGSGRASVAVRTPVDPRRSLRRSVLVEVVVAVVVLVLTTVLTGTLPGRAATEAAAAGQDAGLPVASVIDVPFSFGSPGVSSVRGKAQVTLDPGRVGDNNLQAVVYGADGGFVTVPELRISFTLPDQDVGPLDAKVTDKGGYWGADAVNLPIPGDWEMKVTVRVSEVDQVSVTKPVRIER
ncbi:copper resistance CopC/CopD family protein [Streptomyces sp. AK04-3B]|uniref:copper resistance CopC/CopD family protein n=1 Tax=Streptomyces sp. AK04-3B TaxID=3028650 RepID=UPI0039F47AFD